MDELIGKTLRSYEIRSVIGVGGFGTVYRAYQTSIARDVAIKVISPQAANSERFIQNFEREAKLIGRLEHPHIVPVFDFWRDPHGAYIVMRYIGGGSVEASLIQNGPWSLEQTADLLDQVASALWEAHRNNVVHQDIKAANILLDQQGNAYLSDFGIAKELDQLDEPVDKEEILSGSEAGASGAQPTIHGSPEYMAPEQILRMSVDARTDIYSLGVVLYEILAADKAFHAANDDALLRKQLYEKVPLVRTTRPDIPPQIDQIIQRATSKHPKNRYSDVRQMAREFRQVVSAPEPILITDMLPVEAVEETEAVNPYKGLMAFQEADAENFFGREALIERLYLRMLEPVEGSRFLAVVGASGSGKSSVVRAGLIPMLRKNAPRWFIVEMTPSSDPFAQLTDAILRVAVKPDYPYDEVVRRGVDGLHTTLRHALDEPKRQLVLLIDQFEELFTLTPDESVRRLFIDSLLYALSAPDSQLRVIITLRADFLDRPLSYSGLGELLNKRHEMVIPMNSVQLQHAIEKPAERAGCSLEDGLATQIVLDAANQANVLPLMQFALMHLFENRNRKTRQLTFAQYKDIGGIVGALTKRADQVFNALSPDEQMTTQQLFLRLVRMGEGEEDTRRRVNLAQLQAAQINQKHLQKVLDTFTKARLLVLDRDSETREPTVEIAHEAMLKHWKQLKTWIDDNRESLRIEQQLNQQTAQWLEHQQDRSDLATGARLQRFEELLQSPHIVLEDDARAYLNASIERRQFFQRLRTAAIAGVMVIALIFGVLFLFAQSESQRANIALDNLELAQATTVAERNRADEENLISRSRELAIRALLDTPAKDLRLLLSRAAVGVSDTDSALNTLLMNLQDLLLLDHVLHGPSTDLHTVAYSPDGRWIAGGGSDSRVYLWDAESGALLDVALEHGGEIASVAFDRTGSRVVTGGKDGNVRLWSVPDGELIERVPVNSSIRSTAFSPDDALVAVADDSGLIHLLDGETLEEQRRIEAHEGSVYALAFSPDGETLASGGIDDVIRLWSLADPEADPQVLTGHSNWIWTLAYSPDGQRLASGGFDHSVIVWDVADNYSIEQRLNGHADTVRGVVFSPNSRLLATGGDDDRVILWNVQTGEALSAIPSENLVDVRTLAFNPDSRAAASIVMGGLTPRVEIWNLSEESLVDDAEPIPQTVRQMYFDPQTNSLWAFGNINADQEPDETVDIGWQWSPEDQAYTTKVIYEELIIRETTAAALSPDGSLWANADADGVIKLFDAASGKAVGDALQSAEPGIYSLAFSPDGQLLAAGHVSGRIGLWRRGADAKWQPQDLVLDAHLDRVVTLAFSADGRYLASGSLDSTAILWEITGDSADLTSHTVLSAHSEAVISLAFNPDGSLLLSGGRDGLVAVWDVGTGTLRQQIRLHTSWVGALAFSHNGAYFVSGSRDNTALLWSIREGVANPIGRPFRMGQAVTSAVFSPDDRYLALGGENGRIRIWQASVEDWMATACRQANRNLTDAEIQTYLYGSDPLESCQ